MAKYCKALSDSDWPPCGAPVVAAGLAALLMIFANSASAASASVTYTYDLLGRITTATYDNGVCVAYAYDAVGNRTAQTNTQSSAAQTPIWGAGNWGCFQWTAQGGAQLNHGQPERAGAFAALGPDNSEMAHSARGAVAAISFARPAALSNAESGQ